MRILLSNESSKNPSAKSRFSLKLRPINFPAFSASRVLVAAVPLEPSSPRVKSIIPTFFPSAIYFKRVPEADNSTSSGWAAKARMSSFMMLEYNFLSLDKNRLNFDLQRHCQPFLLAPNTSNLLSIQRGKPLL